MKCSGKCRGRRSRRERRGERERPAFMETMLPIVFFRMILENRHKTAATAVDLLLTTL